MVPRIPRPIVVKARRGIEVEVEIVGGKKSAAHRLIKSVGFRRLCKRKLAKIFRNCIMGF